MQVSEEDNTVLLPLINLLKTIRIVDKQNDTIKHGEKELEAEEVPNVSHFKL